MCKIKIDLDRYKEFFLSPHGFELITDIIDKGDYAAIEEIVKWKRCTAKLLDKIAERFMGSNYAEINFKILEDVAEHSRVSKKTLRNIFDAVSNLLLGIHPKSDEVFLGEHSEEAIEVLEEIAESKKLDEKLAWKLYNLAVEHKLIEVIEELAENSNTPDEILFDIIDRFEDDIVTYQEAYKQIIKRYKKLKQQLNENESK